MEDLEVEAGQPKPKAFLKRTILKKDSEPVTETMPFINKSHLYRFIRGGTTIGNAARSDLIRHGKIEFVMNHELTIILEVSFDD